MWDPHFPLSRRLADSCTVQRRGSGVDIPTASTLLLLGRGRGRRVSVNVKKSTFKHYTIPGVHRSSHRCDLHLSLSIMGKIPNNEGINHFSILQPFSFSPNLPLSLSGLHIRHTLHSPTPALPSTLATEGILPHVSTHAHCAPHATVSSFLTPMVDGPTTSLLRGDLPTVLAHCNNYHECISHRLGCLHGQSHNPKHLDSARVQDAHKSIGTLGSMRSLPSVPAKQPRPTHSCHVKQHHHGLLHKQEGT